MLVHIYEARFGESWEYPTFSIQYCVSGDMLNLVKFDMRWEIEKRIKKIVSKHARDLPSYLEFFAQWRTEEWPKEKENKNAANKLNDE